jgi:ribose transport system permease protein
MKIKLVLRKFGVLAVLILLVGLFSILSPSFFTTGNLFNVVRQVSMSGIVAVGMTFVMLTGGIDLSVGSLLSIVSVAGAWVMVKGGCNPVEAVFICLAVATVFGLFNGLVVTRFNIPPLIATLATMTIIRGISYIITGGLPIYGFPESFTVIGQGYLWIIPIPVIIMVAVLAAGSFILNYSYLGRFFYAIGGNEEATRLTGVNVSNIKLLVYALSGFFAGLAGVILLSRVNSGQPIAGSGFELDVITAVVLGGVSTSGGEGKLSGVIAGVLIMGVLSNGLIIMDIGEYYQMVVKGMVLLIAVGFDRMQPSRVPGL